MQNRRKKQVVLKTITAVTASTVLSTVLLLGLPYIFFVYFVSIVIITHDNPVVHSHSFMPIYWILNGLTVFLPGVALNVILTREFPLLNKILSIILYIMLLAAIAVLLSGSINYGIEHFMT